MADLELLGANDKPALICISSAEWAGLAQAVLTDLGFKPFLLGNPAEFSSRFSQIQYQVVLIDDTYGGSSLADNATLSYIQRLPMNQRRHCVFILLSTVFESMNALQSFQQSVHNIVNYNDISVLGQVVQKTVSENAMFYQGFLDVQRRVNQGK